jgi:hypothetical protein
MVSFRSAWTLWNSWSSLLPIGREFLLSQWSWCRKSQKQIHELQFSGTLHCYDSFFGIKLMLLRVDCHRYANCLILDNLPPIPGCGSKTGDVTMQRVNEEYCEEY